MMTLCAAKLQIIIFACNPNLHRSSDQARKGDEEDGGDLHAAVYCYSLDAIRSGDLAWI